jgi:hypothetical protein
MRWTTQASAGRLALPWRMQQESAAVPRDRRDERYAGDTINRGRYISAR